MTLIPVEGENLYLSVSQVWIKLGTSITIHYKKKAFRWQFFTIKVGYICQGMLLFIYVIYASVKKSLNLPWHLHMSRLFLFLPMIESLLVWHMSMFLSLLSRLDSTYVKILWSYVNVNLLFCQVCCNKC